MTKRRNEMLISLTLLRRMLILSIILERNEVSKKVESKGRERVVVYDEERWRILEEKRKIAREIISLLDRNGIYSRTHGSIARGDVNKNSDIDIFITEYIPSYKIELILEKDNRTIYKKEIVQATPKSTPKVYFYLDPYEKICISFPLAKLLKNELEFYEFGGAVDLEEINKKIRKKGVDKRLMLIIPKEFGHVEKSIIGREAETAKELGISLETVVERESILRKRDEFGRTGTFMKAIVPEKSSVEEFVINLASKNWMLKKVIEERGYF